MNTFIENVKTELITHKRAILNVNVRANAQSTKFKEILTDGTIKLDIALPPVNGLANRELLNFISTLLEVSRDQVQIIRGANSSRKVILITI